MAYSKTTWVNDTTPAINADNLNKIEKGIFDADNNIQDSVVAITDYKNRLLMSNIEFGNITIESGQIVKSNSSLWIRTINPIKIPAYSQFIITNPAFRAFVFYSYDNGATYTSANWITSTSRLFMPNQECLVYFKFSKADNYDYPSIQTVHDGFYIQFPFDTRDYSELVNFESTVETFGKSIPFGKFVIGGMSNGTPNLSYYNRIAFVNLVSYEKNITIKIANGFRIGVHIYENGSFVSDSGWKTGIYEIPAGTTFKFIIGRVTEQTETGNYWWFDFLKAVTFEATEKFPNISLNKPFMYSSRAKFMLHRGLNWEAPENSVPAFELAGQANAWGIETDVYETSDGYFVCIHDNTVDRTTDGTGNVRDKTLAEIKALTIDTGSHIEDYPNLKIPTLEEYLAVCKTYGCVAFIEIKSVTNLQGLFEIIRDYGLLYNCVFIVWESLLKNVRKVDVDAIIPCILNGYSSAETYATILTAAKKYQNIMVGLEVDAKLTDAIIQEAHEYNIGVGCWTVDNLSSAVGYFKRGIDLITSDVFTSVIEQQENII